MKYKKVTQTNWNGGNFPSTVFQFSNNIGLRVKSGLFVFLFCGRAHSIKDVISRCYRPLCQSLITSLVVPHSLAMASYGFNDQYSSMASDSSERRRVGLIYDERMCLHSDPNDLLPLVKPDKVREPHPECPDRIRAIWNKLHSSGIAQRYI